MRRGFVKGVLAVSWAVAALGASSCARTAATNPSPASGAAPSVVAAAATERSWADVVADLRPSIIRVENVTCDGSRSVGSGFAIDGWVLTNRHVVDGYSRLTLLTADGRSAEPTRVRVSESDDLALLSAPASFKALAWATKGPRVADDVAALGFPEGIGFSFAKGSISALDVTLNFGTGPIHGLLQTDTAVNHGNSGGPLINRSGEVVGVVVLKVPDSEGLAFAIDGRHAQVFLAGEHGVELDACDPTAGAPASDTLAPGEVVSPATTAQAQVVIRYYDAVNAQDWQAAWKLGGKNLGRKSYATFVDGYRDTRSNAIEIIDVTGDIVTVEITAIEATPGGDMLATYRGTYEVQGGQLLRGRLKLVGRA